MAAETALRGAGLVLGNVTTAQSHAVPAGGVTSTTPRAGGIVSQASAVNLEISTGRTSRLTQYIFAGLGIIVLIILIYGILAGHLLTSLSDPKIARGLITFLIAVVTVSIALIMVLSTIMLKDGDDADKRFDRGKQILTTMIGVLGTIVGFYFGSAGTEPKSSPVSNIEQQTSPIKLTTTSLPDGTANTPYTTKIEVTGGVPPLKWSIEPALPAGLSLDTSIGAVSGTPTKVSPKTKYKITVVDSATPAASSTAEITLEIKL
jgi:uncharacterized membrane protein YfcA